MSKFLKAPFPWFGGKSMISDKVWPRFGSVRNYVEPFFGSGAMLLNRPLPFDGVETVNDKDGFVSNFWRALQKDPDSVSHHAEWPVNENDLHARHIWLLDQKQRMVACLEGDAEWYDAKTAGWWVWGISCWIGSGFCSGKGPWQSVQDKDGTRQLVHLGDAGQGVNRKLVHLGDAGKGVKRQLVHLGNAGKGVKRQLVLQAYMQCLSERLERVRVACGDWSRVVGPSVTIKHGVTAVFLDPPYADTAGRTPEIYAEESLTVAHEVREWAIKNGDDCRLRIALCGYDGEHKMPSTWSCIQYSAGNGMANSSNHNRHRERIWFSPHCISPDNVQHMLWDDEA